MAREGTGEALLPVLKNQMRSARTALWLRPAIFSVVAATAAVLLATVDIVLPSGSLDWLPEVETAAVVNLLEVLASGLLTVATVTLSVHIDRKSVVKGKSVSVRVEHGGRRTIQKKKH